jgi:hypothetical protein
MVWEPPARLVCHWLVGDTPTELEVRFAAERDGGTVVEIEHRAMALDALKDLSVRYEPIAAADSRLAAHATVSGTHSGGFLGVAATGKTVSWREVHLFDVRDGRIASQLDGCGAAGRVPAADRARPAGDRAAPIGPLGPEP